VAPGNSIIAPPAAPEESPSNEESHPRYSLAQLGLYFLRLGTFGFGGPIALVGYMQRDLIERRQWVVEQDFREGLAPAQLAPGPLAAQPAIYLGWVRGRALGTTLIAIAADFMLFICERVPRLGERDRSGHRHPSCTPAASVLLFEYS
jgi:hypothetical protein